MDRTSRIALSVAAFVISKTEVIAVKASAASPSLIFLVCRPVIHPDAAGIDIGNESHYAAVPPSRDGQPVRRFGCTTSELKAMAAWLQQCGIHGSQMSRNSVLSQALSLSTVSLRTRSAFN
jgi:hypothetical protein